MKWFKHDSDASRDAKLKRLTMRHGMVGYGLYWYCVELIASKVSTDNVTFRLEHDSEIIAHDTGINHDTVKLLLDAMVELNLFERDEDGSIKCSKLAKRLDQSMVSNPQMRKIIKDLRNNEDNEQPQNHDAVMIKSGQIRLDKNRIDIYGTTTNDKKKRKRFVKPTIDEIKKYCKQRKNNIDPEKFYYHYESKGWKVGKSPMKSWECAVITWEKNSDDSPSQLDSQLAGAL